MVFGPLGQDFVCDEVVDALVVDFDETGLDFDARFLGSWSNFRA